MIGQLAVEFVPWRVGRKVGRTIYARLGPVPSDDDVLIGLMDTSAVALHVVAAHNAMLREAMTP